jgi:hypothetical protein
VPAARFFFDAGSGIALWADTAPQEQGQQEYAVDLRGLPVSQDLRDELESLVTRYDTSLNRDYPPDPGPWRESQCRQFNHDARPDPDLNRYLADPSGFARTPC